MNLLTIFILIFVVSVVNAQMMPAMSVRNIAQDITIHDVSNQDYVITKSDPVFLFSQNEFLYHVYNLTATFELFNEINDENCSFNMEQKLLINRIQNLKKQIAIHHEVRPKRAIYILGTLIKFLTGIPDHTDAVIIKQHINDLIKNNNKQRRINSQILESIKLFKTNEHNCILTLQEVYHEIKIIADTIENAKLNLYNLESLNIQEIDNIIRKEHTDLPLINILQYSKKYVCRINDLIILILKYPIIEYRCEEYILTPLQHKHGKYIIDKQIAKCSTTYIRNEQCENFLNVNICKKQENDNCTIPLLNNRPAKCNILEEHNEPLTLIKDGVIFVDGNHMVNNYEPVVGPKVITYKFYVKIDNKTFINHEQEMRRFIKTYKNSNVEILDMIQTLNKKFEFKNIEKLHAITIPFETHPILSTIITILVIIKILIFTYYVKMFCNWYSKFKTAKHIKNMNKHYYESLKAIGLEHRYEETKLSHV